MTHSQSSRGMISHVCLEDFRSVPLASEAKAGGHTVRKYPTVSRSDAGLASACSDRCRTVPAGLLGQNSDNCAVVAGDSRWPPPSGRSRPVSRRAQFIIGRRDPGAPPARGRGRRAPWVRSCRDLVEEGHL